MMNKIQAKELYEKMFASYPDVLTVEDATKLLGFKSQTGRDTAGASAQDSQSKSWPFLHDSEGISHRLSLG